MYRKYEFYNIITYLDFKIHIDNYYSILESFKDFQLLDFDAVNFILRSNGWGWLFIFLLLFTAGYVLQCT